VRTQALATDLKAAFVDTTIADNPSFRERFYVYHNSMNKTALITRAAEYEF
jgi:hypothetical protein